MVQALGELSSLMLATPDLEDLLTRVAELAAASVGRTASCAITMQPADRAFTVASSDELAAQVDELQYSRDDGPCLQTMRTGTVVSVPDLTVETRWGDYPAHALAQGVRSSLGLPLIAEGRSVGALNLYARETDVFTEELQQAAMVFAASAAGAITMSLRFAHQLELSEQLQTALSSRAVIDQAIGIVIRDRRCTPEEGFDVLRAASQRRNVKLRVVAAELVDSMSRKPRPGSPH